MDIIEAAECLESWREDGPEGLNLYHDVEQWRKC